jgi:hypothetical protein
MRYINVRRRNNTMSTNQYAEHQPTKPEEILQRLRQVKMWHLYITPVSEDFWGYDGLDIETVEESNPVDSKVAEVLFNAADATYGVAFGSGGPGLCFEAGQRYCWLAPVIEK